VGCNPPGAVMHQDIRVEYRYPNIPRDSRTFANPTRCSSASSTARAAASMRIMPTGSAIVSTENPVNDPSAVADVDRKAAVVGEPFSLAAIAYHAMTRPKCSSFSGVHE